MDDPAKREADRRRAREKAVHDAAEAMSVVMINVPLLRAHVLTFEGRLLLDDIVAASERFPGLVDRLRQSI